MPQSKCDCGRHECAPEYYCPRCKFVKCRDSVYVTLEDLRTARICGDFVPRNPKCMLCDQPVALIED